MPSILSETLLTLHDAARLLPSNRAGKRVNFATVWRWVEADPAFPRPFKLGPAITVWNEQEVLLWLQSKRAVRAA